MNARFCRRHFLGICGALGAGAWAAAQSQPNSLPLVDLHVHLDNSTLEQVLALSAERGVRFGIVEHAGTRENVYPVVLSNDEELQAYLNRLEGKPVFKGIQAEYTDWAGCFSREMLEKLDYILTDTWTFPGPDGKRKKMWEKDFDPGEPQQFMDRYVDWHVQVMSTAPIDILANVSWLPGVLAEQYDALWTGARIQKVLETAQKFQVAIEISSAFSLPKGRWLQMAREAKLKFCFGSNGRYPKMGLLDYSLKTAQELGLTADDLFTPAPDGQRAAQRRSY